jgi:hypothetical protein
MSTDIAAFLETRYAPAAVPRLPVQANAGSPRNTILHGDCLRILLQLAGGSVDFALTDPPYLVRYCGRDGRRVPNDDNDAWLSPAFAELYRVLADDRFAVSFYGWPHADRFLLAWRAAGFRIVGHFAFPKRYTSTTRLVRYQHECAYLLAKGDPKEPEYAIGDVIDWTYSGNRLHPTQKPLGVLLPLVETFLGLWRAGVGPVRRLRLLAAGRKDVGPRLARYRARCRIPRHRQPPAWRRGHLNRRGCRPLSSLAASVRYAASVPAGSSTAGADGAGEGRAG